MTNGEKLKEIFPNGVLTSCGNNAYYWGDDILVSKNWWNAEYKPNKSENPNSSTSKNDLAVDCILRADVNQVIEDYMDEQYHVLSDRTRERANGANAVKARINELPTVIPQEPRWIPCSERLPKESLNSVIGWDAYRERCVFVQYINGYFQITGSDESFNIVAWMPFLKPYQGRKRK